MIKLKDALRMLTVGAVALPKMAVAQDALKSSIALQASEEGAQTRAQQPPANYTLKLGDSTFLAEASLTGDWNDNVYLKNTGADDDFILTPLMQLTGTVPLTGANTLTISLGAGYNKYLYHPDLSNWYLQSGSAVMFDIFIKDFRINLHDTFSYSQDASQEAAISGTGDYGLFQNTSGLSADWNLGDVILTLGYDHQIAQSTTSGTYELDNRSAELLTARAGFVLRPNVTAGLEATGSFTKYDEHILNNSDAYSFGAYGDWKPGAFLRIQPRAGFYETMFEQTGTAPVENNLATWYADLTVSHQVTTSISYSLSVGHETRVGVNTDIIEDTYVRPALTWSPTKVVTLTGSIAYEHGKQSSGGTPGDIFAGEVYDYFQGSLTASYEITKNLSLTATGRFVVRTSSESTLGYDQDLIGLTLNYKFF